MLSVIAYNFFLAVFFPFLAVIMLVKMLQTRREWMERWGFLPKYKNRYVIWIHGSSVGEINSLKSLCSDLSSKHPRFRFLVTSYTRTGVIRADEILSRNNVKTSYFPFDFPLSIINAIYRVKPSCVLFTETEIWPNFLFFCRLNKIPVFLLSARISDRTYPRYKAFRRFLKRVLSSYSYVFAQDELNARRFIDIGVPVDRISRSGSLKASDEKLLPPPIPVAEGTFLWIAGPVRKGEFEKILEVYSFLKNKYPFTALLLAPRYLEMTQEILKSAESMNIDAVLRSRVSELSPGVTILDSLGELQRFYKEAKVAFIGGSLVNAGGHNPLEAAFQGVPVLMGPYFQNVEETMTKLARAKGAWIVQSQDDLKNALEKIISNEDLRRSASENIRNAALELVVSKDEIYGIIEKKTPHFPC
ncbi:glycosyltransferase [candidate division WOR-3 bacterium]|nr:glycosyltransferase [candidate division WOR-3 bacterium]